jgi:TolB-like protein/DNA-binding winged helix-turn-helix (wHTH) protein
MSTGYTVDVSFYVGDWLVQPSLNTVSRNGRTARLEPKVMEVLIRLAEQAGQTVSKEDLLGKVWPDTFVSDDVLTRSISELRRAFADDPKDSHFIQTIPKRGYRLVAAVIPLNGPAELPSKSTIPDRIRKAFRQPSMRTLATVGALLLLGLIAWLKASDFSGLLSVNPSTPPIHSLAVLPLQNLSGDSNQGYFTDAMTEELITELSRIRALNVISRTSVMPYKDSKKSLPEIARELHADAVVAGSIMRSGERVRVTVQLINAARDTNIWAQTYDRDVQDVLNLQRAVATSIANEIRVRVTPDEQGKLKAPRPVNPKALDAYVEARYHFDQAQHLVYYCGKQKALEEEFRKALSFLDLAIQQDPAYLPAYVGYFEAVDAPGISNLENLSRAKAALTKALELDETNVQAHLALGQLLMQYEYDWRGSERQLRRALELSPNSGEAHYQFAEYLANIGRSAEGDKELDLAQALDPSRDYFADAGVHRLGNTIEQDRQALEEKAPNDPFALAAMGKVYAIEGRYKESVEMWERSLSLYGWSDFVRVLKQADTRGGPKFALEQWMRAAEEYDKKHADMPVVAMAFTYTSLGNKDRAFAWLDKAMEQRNWMIIYLKRDNVWDPLRSDPRFAELLRRVGLPG